MKTVILRIVIALSLLLATGFAHAADDGCVLFNTVKPGQKFPAQKFKREVGCLFQPAKGGKFYIGTTKVEGEKDYHLGSTGSGKVTIRFFLPGTDTPAITRRGGGWSGISIAVTSLKVTGAAAKKKGFDVISYDINGAQIANIRIEDSDALVWLEKGVHKVEIIPHRAANKTCVSVLYQVRKKGYLTSAPAKKDI